LEFLIKIVHTYYTFTFTLNCKIFTQLSPTLTKLCRIKQDHPVNFYISQHIHHVFY